MSFSASLSNAISGLNVAARSARVVSDNVANALTEGYGRREIEISSRVLAGAGAGAQVDGIRRAVDAALLGDRRLADAELGRFTGQTAFLEKSVDLLGAPDEAGSLADRLRSFEAALLEAASRPDSEPRLDAVLSTAKNLTAKLNTAADAIQAERLAADTAIADQVDRLNGHIEQVEDLNGEIARLSGAGQDVSGLFDARQRVIDDIASLVPVREVQRDRGVVALYTLGGTTLIDGPARSFEFSPVNFVTADMTLASGALSPLTLDGDPVATTGDFAPMGGGSLSALFEVRDDLAPAAQDRLDAFARDLMERFEEAGVDPTAAPGDPGLFTDGGAAFDATDEVGLAGRIAINDLVDPDAGGSLAAFRDGLAAATPGPVGNSEQLYRFADALTAIRAPADDRITGAERTAFTLLGDLMGRAGGDLAEAERQESFASTRQSTLRDAELANGVDTDQEMQKLLLIEQAYAANARVIQTIDELMDQLLRI